MKRVLLAAVCVVLCISPAVAQFSFTTLDYPGATLTTARGINDSRQIVGAYRVTFPRHALLMIELGRKQAGRVKYVALDPLLGPNYSEAFRINNRGDIVGQYWDENQFAHGFLLRDGQVTTLDFPGADDTTAFGINESGTIVGTWDLTDSQQNPIENHGFIWSNGAFTQVDFPGAKDTSVFAINAQGDMVGAWDNDINGPSHGFVYTHGQFINLDVPFSGAVATQAHDISANGKIVGYYTDALSVAHGFIAEGAKFTTIDVPGATATAPWGINSGGQIVGDYLDANSAVLAFLAQRSKP
jgi:uncharacterized membrane protein